MISADDVTELYVAILHGAKSVAETGFFDAGPAYEEAFDALIKIGELAVGTDSLPNDTGAWGWDNFRRHWRTRSAHSPKTGDSGILVACRGLAAWVGRWTRWDDS